MVFRLIIVLFFFSVGAFSQEKFTKHKISKGENITVIAKKYGVKVKDIQDANPNAPKVLKLNSVLLIPNKNVRTAQKSSQTEASKSKNIAYDAPGSHEVSQKETLWGIAKKYNVSVDELKKANPTLETDGLKIGQHLNIPSNAGLAFFNSSTETLYFLAIPQSVSFCKTSCEPGVLLAIFCVLLTSF